MRSKKLLVANILATCYTAFLLYSFIGAIVEAGGADFVYAMGSMLGAVYDLLGMSDIDGTLLYVLAAAVVVHVAAFVLGCLIGWIAFACKKSGGAKFAAVLYLIGTICFPIFLLFGLPITIVGFVGGGDQKKLNAQSTAEKAE